MKFSVTVQDFGIDPMLKRLATESPGVVSKGFNKTIFEIRDAEVAMTATSFDFWSPVTKNFMAAKRSFPFDLSTPSRLEATLYAGTASAGRAGKLREIFWQQEFGFTLDPKQHERLVLGNKPPAYAVPTKDPAAHLRTPRATVKQSQTPGALVTGTSQFGRIKVKRRRRRKRGVGNLGTHVFVSPNGKAILEKMPGGGVRFLYGLYDRPIKVDEHLEFLDTAIRVIGQVLIPKLLTEWDKSFSRF